PNTATYAADNRTHMIRIPSGNRCELRLADGSVNPYLLQAAILVAGLDGISEGRYPGKTLDINMYTECHLAKDAKQLPLNLLDGLRALDDSVEFRRELGPVLVASYLKLKLQHWNDYCSQMSDWERSVTLDV